MTTLSRYELITLIKDATTVTISSAIIQSLTSIWGEASSIQLKNARNQLEPPKYRMSGVDGVNSINFTHTYTFDRRFEYIHGLRQRVKECYNMSDINDDLTIDDLINLLMKA